MAGAPFRYLENEKPLRTAGVGVLLECYWVFYFWDLARASEHMGSRPSNQHALEAAVHHKAGVKKSINPNFKPRLPTRQNTKRMGFTGLLFTFLSQCVL